MSIIDDIRGDLKAAEKLGNLVDAQQFFKEKLKHRFVLRTPILRKIALNHFKAVKTYGKTDFFVLCEKMLALDEKYFSTIVFEWTCRRPDLYTAKDINRFERWLKEYVCGWSAVDHFAGTIGELVFNSPELVARLEKWAKSNNLWVRRMAAVAMIYSVRHKQGLKDAFAIADILLEDEEDLVQKGYAWMLKVAGDRYQKEVFNYVMKNKRRMPRTALRYAIEKMPKDLKSQAMKKDW